jgi:hypothetical protein
MGVLPFGMGPLGGAVQRVSVPMDTAPPENGKPDFSPDFWAQKGQQ